MGEKKKTAYHYPSMGNLRLFTIYRYPFFFLIPSLALDTDKEKAGGRGAKAPRGKRRKPEPVNTQLEEETEAEETSRDGRSKRKDDGELNSKNKQPKTLTVL